MKEDPPNNTRVSILCGGSCSLVLMARWTWWCTSRVIYGLSIPLMMILPLRVKQYNYIVLLPESEENHHHQDKTKDDELL